MRYFSRIRLDVNYPGARDALAPALGSDAHADHRFLWRFFPGPQGAARDFLFRRFDSAENANQPVFYCVAKRPAVTIHPAWEVESREYAPRLRGGDRLSFDLRINPTRAHKRDGGSRRDDVVMHAKKEMAAAHGVARWRDVPESARPTLYELVDKAVRNWLGDRSQPGYAARHGFLIPDDLRVDAYRRHQFQRQGAAPITLSTVDLTGVLEVTDADLFGDALLNGIGRGKAFGCGLLLVRRAGTGRIL
jgi:CRISPR system Cascade subunit CasE